MVEALYLPPSQTQKHHAVQFRFSRHVIYGNILTAHYNGQTEAVLPPFTTLDIQRLSQFAELDNTSVLNQFLHSLNTLIHNNQHIGDIILNYNGSQYSSTIIPEIVEKPVAPTTKSPKKPSKPWNRPPPKCKAPPPTSGKKSGRSRIPTQYRRSRFRTAAP